MKFRPKSEEAMYASWEAMFATLIENFSVEECVGLFHSHVESNGYEVDDREAIAYLIGLAESI